MSGRHVSGRPDPVGRRLIALVVVLLAAALVLTLLAIFGDDPGVVAGETTSTSAGTTTPGTTAPAAITVTGTNPTTSTVSASTTDTTPSTTAPTSTLADPLDALPLNATGIGDVVFGTGVDETVAQLSAVLGSPTEDTGWTPSFETCPGTEARVVRWTSLQTFFTNGATDWAPEGTQHFFHFGQSTLAGGGVLIDLTTTTGIGINSTLRDLAAAYGNQARIVDDPVFGPFWEVDVPGAGVLWGTAGAMGENGMIDSINGGSGCGE